jgi:hypothetical protein
MNRLIKDIVDVAFRLSAWDREKKAALDAKKRPAPVPKLVADYLRGMAGRREPSPTGGLYDDRARSVRRWIAPAQDGQGGQPHPAAGSKTVSSRT